MNATTLDGAQHPGVAVRDEATQPIDPSAIYRRLQKPTYRRTRWNAIVPAALVVVAGGALIYGLMQQPTHTLSPQARTALAAAQQAAAAKTNADLAAAEAKDAAANAPSATVKPAPAQTTPAAVPAAHPAHRPVVHVARFNADAAPAADRSGRDASASLPNDTAPTPSQAPVNAQPMTPSAPTAVAPQVMTPDTVTAAPSVPSPQPVAPSAVNPAPVPSAPAVTTPAPSQQP